MEEWKKASIITYELLLLLLQFTTWNRCVAQGDMRSRCAAVSMESL